MNYHQLKNYVLEHSNFYYNLSAPRISDAEWDRVYEQLEKMEYAQGWRDSDSPTLKVGGAAGSVYEIYYKSTTEVLVYGNVLHTEDGTTAPTGIFNATGY